MSNISSLKGSQKDLLQQNQIFKNQDQKSIITNTKKLGASSYVPKKVKIFEEKPLDQSSKGSPRNQFVRNNSKQKSDFQQQENDKFVNNNNSTKYNEKKTINFSSKSPINNQNNKIFSSSQKPQMPLLKLNQSNNSGKQFGEQGSSDEQSKQEIDQRSNSQHTSQHTSPPNFQQYDPQLLLGYKQVTVDYNNLIDQIINSQSSEDIIQRLIYINETSNKKLLEGYNLSKFIMDKSDQFRQRLDEFAKGYSDIQSQIDEYSSVVKIKDFDKEQWNVLIKQGETQQKEIEEILKQLNFVLVYCQPIEISAQLLKKYERSTDAQEMAKDTNYKINGRIQEHKHVVNKYKLISDLKENGFYQEIQQHLTSQGIKSTIEQWLQIDEQTQSNTRKDMLAFAKQMQHYHSYTIYFNDLQEQFRYLIYIFSQETTKIFNDLDKLNKKYTELVNNFLMSCQELIRTKNYGRNKLQNIIIKSNRALYEAMNLQLPFIESNNREQNKNLIQQSKDKIKKLQDKLVAQIKKLKQNIEMQNAQESHKKYMDPEQLQHVYKTTNTNINQNSLSGSQNQQQFYLQNMIPYLNQQKVEEIETQLISFTEMQKKLSEDMQTVEELNLIEDYELQMFKVQALREEIQSNLPKTQHFDALINYFQQLNKMLEQLAEVRNFLGCTQFTDSKLLFPGQMLKLDSQVEGEMLLIENLKDAIEDHMQGVDDQAFIDIEQIYEESLKLKDNIYSIIRDNCGEQDYEKNRIDFNEINSIVSVQLDNLAAAKNKHGISENMRQRGIEIYDELAKLSSDFLVWQSIYRTKPLITGPFIQQVLENTLIPNIEEQQEHGGGYSLRKLIGELTKLQILFELNLKQNQQCQFYNELLQDLIAFLNLINLNYQSLKRDVENQRTDKINIEIVMQELKEKAGRDILEKKKSLQQSQKDYAQALDKYIFNNKDWWNNRNIQRDNDKKLAMTQISQKDLEKFVEDTSNFLLKLGKSNFKTIFKGKEVLQYSDIFKLAELNFQYNMKDTKEKIAMIEKSITEYPNNKKKWTPVQQQFLEIEKCLVYLEKMAKQIYLLYIPLRQQLLGQPKIDVQNIQQLKQLAKDLMDNLDIGQKISFDIEKCQEVFQHIYNLSKITLTHLNYFYKSVTNFIKMTEEFQKNNYVIDINNDQLMEQINLFLQFSATYHEKLQQVQKDMPYLEKTNVLLQEIFVEYKKKYCNLMDGYLKDYNLEILKEMHSVMNGSNLKKFDKGIKEAVQFFKDMIKFQQEKTNIAVRTKLQELQQKDLNQAIICFDNLINNYDKLDPFLKDKRFKDMKKLNRIFKMDDRYDKIQMQAWLSFAQDSLDLLNQYFEKVNENENLDKKDVMKSIQDIRTKLTTDEQTKVLKEFEDLLITDVDLNMY